MRELRVQHSGEPYRVLYAFDPRRTAILLVGGKKTGDDRWYDTFVPLAETVRRTLGPADKRGVSVMAKKFRDLVAQIPEERQARIAAKTRQPIDEMPLQELRRALDLTQ